jgi:hypothetical protein
VPACCLGYFWPIAPMAVAPILSRPSLADVPRPASAPTAPRGSDRNVVYVCRGSACTTGDVRTHEFSRPPAQVQPEAPGVTPGVTPAARVAQD